MTSASAFVTHPCATKEPLVLTATWILAADRHTGSQRSGPFLYPAAVRELLEGGQVIERDRRVTLSVSVTKRDLVNSEPRHRSSLAVDALPLFLRIDEAARLLLRVSSKRLSNMIAEGLLTEGNTSFAGAASEHASGPTR